jgi:hypothetical protein
MRARGIIRLGVALAGAGAPWVCAASAARNDAFVAAAGQLGMVLGVAIGVAVGLWLLRGSLPGLRWLLPLLLLAGAGGGFAAWWNRAPTLAPLPPAAWAAQPPSQWPQIVLTNRASFSGHSALQGASAFLLQNRRGQVFGATARHLLGSDGGVEPPLSADGLDAALRDWHMHPRTRQQDYVQMGGVAVAGLDAPGYDWLLLRPRTPLRAPVAQPLQARATPVQIGETVHLIGCPYEERSCRQKVYSGKVVERRHDRFRFEIQPWVDLRGFSGAPIVDRNGHAVGVMTVWFEPRQVVAVHIEAGGEDVASIVHRLEQAEGGALPGT